MSEILNLNLRDNSERILNYIMHEMPVKIKYESKKERGKIRNVAQKIIR